MPTFTGYPSSYRAPFTALQLLFGQGPSNAPAGPRSAMYIGPMTASGSAVANTRYTITSEQDAVTLFGNGSPLHRMIRMHLLSNTLGAIYAIPYAASSGAGVATATATITLTGTPTASKLLTTTVCGEVITTAFSTLDTVTTIAASVVAQINAKVWLPCVASNVAGVITLTAKVAGASQGDGTVGVIRFRSVLDAGSGVTVAVSGVALGISTGVAGADGATTELANLTAALATITNARFYYMGFSVWSSTQVAPITTHVFNKSQTNPGLRCRAFTAYTGTLSALATIAIAANFERQHFIHQTNSEWDTAYLVGNTIAVHQSQEQPLGGFVEDYYRAKDWMCPAAFNAADWPTATNVNDAVTEGIMEIGSDQFGSFITMSVNSRSRDATGTITDFRATETHRVSFMDTVGDTWLQRDAVQYGSGFKLMPDQLMPDGSINFNQRIPTNTLTPSLYKPFGAAIINEMIDNGLLQNAPAWLASLTCSIDPNNVSRLIATASGRTIDVRHQTAIQLAETTPG
jgi:hypothetical protein